MAWFSTFFEKPFVRIETRPDPTRAVRARIYGRLPIAELIKRGWVEVEDVRDPELVEIALCRFFRVNRIEDASVFAFAARKTDVGKESSRANSLKGKDVTLLAEK